MDDPPAHSKQSSHRPTTVLRSARQWWKDVAARDGIAAAIRRLLVELGGFIRDSAPERSRSRFGDAEYDWEHRVNTTSGAVGWRDRLLGVFHSPYQPTEAGLFHAMMAALAEQPGFDFRTFTFIDLGSGKGRTLLMASDYPFQRIVGVELLSSLHAAAVENIGKYKNESQKCFSLQALCGDATEFELPNDPLVLFLFNPLPEAGLRRAMERMGSSFRDKPRELYLVYHNPVLQHLIQECAGLRKTVATEQFSIFTR